MERVQQDHDHDYEQIQLTQLKAVKVIIVGGALAYADMVSKFIITLLKRRPGCGLYFSSGKWFHGAVKLGSEFYSGERYSFGEFVLKVSVCVLVVNCYHTFTGLKRGFCLKREIVLNPPLVKLDGKLLDVGISCKEPFWA